MIFIHYWFINRQVAVPPRCYFLNQNSFGSFIEQWNCPELITSFDVSNCYWISAEFLENTICSMTQLNELNVEGTELNLSNISRIFLKCQHISKISITLLEVVVDMEHLKLELDCTTLSSLQEGFKKLVSLRLLSYNCSTTTSMNSWVAILQLLR